MLDEMRWARSSPAEKPLLQSAAIDQPNPSRQLLVAISPGGPDMKRQPRQASVAASEFSLRVHGPRFDLCVSARSETGSFLQDLGLCVHGQRAARRCDCHVAKVT